eukprot:3917735-Ditylum_brightwellii.AAC.1
MPRNKKEKFEKFLACYARLSIKGKPITGKITTTIKNTWCKVELRKDCHKQFQWKQLDFDAVNWVDRGRVFCEGDFYHKRFIT